MFLSNIQNKEGLTEKQAIVLSALRVRGYERLVLSTLVWSDAEAFGVKFSEGTVCSILTALAKKGLVIQTEEGAYLTDEGLMRFDDGKGFPQLEDWSEEDLAKAEKILDRSTGYKTMQELIRNYPTLQPFGFRGAIWLRRKYLELTGRPAFC